MLRIFTIGHSTHTIAEFIALLKKFGIKKVIDVRTITRSRHNPQFNAEYLSRMLKSKRISYLQMKELGGLRHPMKDSINTAWRNASFRGFADYMQTEKFKDGIQTLINNAGKKKIALMCAEALFWRCHRSLIADALLMKGIRVEHILNQNLSEYHKLTPFAKVNSGEISYPGK